MLSLAISNNALENKTKFYCDFCKLIWNKSNLKVYRNNDNCLFTLLKHKLKLKHLIILKSTLNFLFNVE